MLDNTGSLIFRYYEKNDKNSNIILYMKERVGSTSQTNLGHGFLTFPQEMKPYYDQGQVAYASRYLGQGVHQEIIHKDNKFYWRYNGDGTSPLYEFPITPCRDNEDLIYPEMLNLETGQE